MSTIKPYIFYDAIMTHKPTLLKPKIVRALTESPDWGAPGFEATYKSYGGEDSDVLQTVLKFQGFRCVSFGGSWDGKWSNYGTQQALVNAIIGYERFGQQCFVLDTCMERDLSKTSVNGLLRKHLKVPYPCFYVSLPDTLGMNESLLWGSSTTGGNTALYSNTADDGYFNRLGGFFVERIRIPDGPKRTRDALQIVMVGTPDDSSDYAADVATAHLFLDFEGVDWTSPTGLADHVEAILRDAANDNGDPGTPDFEDPRVAYQAAKVKDTMRHVVRLAINLCLYVNSRNPDLLKKRVVTKREVALRRKLEKSKRHRSIVRLKRKLLSAQSTSFTYVGREHEVDCKEGRAQHYRRAHWHTYYVGKRKYANGDRIPLHLQDTEILWVGMTEVNKDSMRRTEKRTYLVEHGSSENV